MASKTAVGWEKRRKDEKKGERVKKKQQKRKTLKDADPKMTLFGPDAGLSLKL